MAIVKFGEVASRLNIHVDQANTDLEYYIGGEHIESREFMIHSKAPIKGATIGAHLQKPVFPFITFCYKISLLYLCLSKVI